MKYPMLLEARPGLCHRRNLLWQWLHHGGLLVLLLGLSLTAHAQRHLEKLGRGVVAVRKSSTQVYVGWRLLGNDPDSIAFNLYRSANGAAPVKVNASPLSNTTDYTDMPANLSTTAYTYSVKPVLGGVEVADIYANTNLSGFTLPANAPTRQYLPLPLHAVDSSTNKFAVKFCWVGDLDGDGEYDYIVDRLPINGGHEYVQAYKRDGTFLWQVDLGINSTNLDGIEPGAGAISVGNWDGVTAYDLDGDGKAEVILKTCNGVSIANAAGVQVANITAADNTTQFISVIDGLTGAERARAPWPTDYISDGPTAMMFGIAYLNGVTPSVVIKGKNRQGSGAFNEMMAAFGYAGTNFVQQWKWLRGSYNSADGHQIRISDVDNDGKDEILDFGVMMKGNGTPLYNLTSSAGIGHGDRQHVTDIDPDRPGLEVFAIQQDNPSLLATVLYEAGTGKIIRKWFSGGVTDVGRGITVDIDPSHKGCEFFSTQPGIFDCQGNQLYASSIWPPEGLWWDADLGREFIEGDTGPTIDKFNPSTGSTTRLYSVYKEGVYESDGGRPAFWGDILGDWREELVLVASDYSEIRVYLSTIAATNRLYTLMHNPQYRAQTTLKGYVEASYVDYYLGWGMTPPQPPPQSMARLVWRGDVSGVWDTSAANWRTNWFYAGNANTTPTAFNSGSSVLFDLSGSNTPAIALTGTLTPGDVTVYSPTDYAFDGSAGALSGTMKLVKQGAGTLTLSGSHDYSGSTTVWDGALLVNGNVQNSAVTVWGGTWGGALAQGQTGGRVGGTGQFGQPVVVKYRGAVTPGAGMNSPGTISFANGLSLESDSSLALDLSDDYTGAVKSNDVINITGNITVTGRVHLVINPLNGNLPQGAVYPLIRYTGTLVGSLTNFDVLGLDGVPVALTNWAGQIGLVVKSYRPPATITWTGGSGANAWDLLATSNWVNGAVKDQFAPYDSVRFDSVGASNLTVTLSGTLNASSIIVDSATNYTFIGTGTIGGSTGLVKTNSGTLTVTAANNTFTGKTVLAGGVLSVAKLDAVGFASPLGNPPGGSTNLVISNNATLRITGESYTDRGLTIGAGTNSIEVYNAADQLTVAGQIVGGGALQKSGAGGLALTTSNAYTGMTLIKGGSVSLGAGTVNQYGFGPGPGKNGNTTLILDGGRLNMFSDSGSYDKVYWNLVVPTSSTGTLNTDARCNLYGTLTGGGALTVIIDYVRTEFDGDWSAFTGEVNVTTHGSGDFRVGNSAGYANATINLASGTYLYHVSGSPVSVGAVSGSVGSGMSGTPWTVGAKNTDATFAGNITGKSITKVGTGTWTLSGTNTYTGTTTVSAGTLLINGNSAAASGIVTVGAASTLGGTGTIGGATMVNGRLAPGSNGIGTLTFSNHLTLNSGSLAFLEINRTAGTCDLATTSGTLTYGGTLQVTNLAGTLALNDSFKLFQAVAYTGGFDAFQLPALSSGLAWNTANLASNGTISVISAGTPPAAPTNLVATAVSFAQINLIWSDASFDELSFLIERSTNGMDFLPIGSVSANVTAYSDTGVTAGTLYYYRVRAANNGGNSAWSNIASALTPLVALMVKSDTPAMNTPVDWSGIAPSLDGVGLFNNLLSATNAAALTLGSNVALAGMVFSTNLNGPVTIAVGNTLTLGRAGIDLGAANQNVTLNPALSLVAAQTWNITNGRTLTVNGAFTSASNTVTKLGAGTLALGATSGDAGANIQVDAGTVQVNASSGIMVSLNGGSFKTAGAYLNNPINVMAAGGIELNDNNNRTWQGRLTGSGPLTVVASAVHTWSGNNTSYTGTITLQGSGSLRLSSLNAVSPLTAYNLNGGTMSANAGGLFSLGSLSGSGTLYTGTGQNFSIGNLGTDTLFSGGIAGAGFIVKTGSATLILTGTNTYTGGTIVSAGTLQIGNGDSSGALGPGNITNNAMLVFNRSDDISDASFGRISGTGALMKAGDGLLTLTNAHSYSGPTLIESGALALAGNGSIANSTSINVAAEALIDVSGRTAGGMTLTSGTVLSGRGTVKGDFVMGSGALLSPGNSIGTLTFSNSLTLSDGSTSLFEISSAPAACDQVNVLGKLSCGGTLIVTNLGSSPLAPGDSFLLLNAPSLSGSFSRLVLPPLSAGLAWDTNSLVASGVLSVVSVEPPAFDTVTRLGDGNLRLVFSGTASQAYEIRATSNLTLAPLANWTLLGSGVFGSDPVVFDDLQATNFPQRFYLIRIP